MSGFFYAIDHWMRNALNLPKTAKDAFLPLILDVKT